MHGVRNGAVGSAISALVFVSPGVVLLMIMVAEMPIDLLMNLLALALLSLSTIGALGWFALQRQGALSDGTLIFKHDPHSEEAERVPAPPV
jgi:hypothetical protein